MKCLPLLLTEALAFLCVSAFLYFTCKGIKKEDYKLLIISGFSLAYLALVKIIFGYVLLATTVVVLIAFIFDKNKVVPYGLILLFSFLFVTPYLICTYSITGEVYYWGNSGGMSFYWLSSPYENELGDWHSFSLTESPQLEANHREYINSISNLNPVEKDSELKRKAIDNILNNKGKFAYNWVANVSRIFFSYPLSFLKPSCGILYYALPNMVLITLSFFSYNKKYTS